MNWRFWACMYWLFWGISFGVWETYAGLNNQKVPMLTQVICRYVPGPVTMIALTWAWWHFFSRYYVKEGYIDWLKTGLKSSLR